MILVVIMKPARKLFLLCLATLMLVLACSFYVYDYQVESQIRIGREIMDMEARPTLSVPTEYNHTIIATTSGIRQKAFLLAIVISAPENKDKRDAVRRTWKNSYTQPNKQFLVKFVIGTLGLEDQVAKSLLAEDEQHNDMLLLTDHLDNYNNLTRKVLHMFVWADQNVDFSYLLKADDDAFVLLDAIESELRERNTSKLLYWGNIIRGARPQKKGKWKEDRWDISDKYLPYAQGGGYVLSAELIHRIATNAEGLILYNNEDVAVGAWISPFELDSKFDDRFDTYKDNVKSICKEYLVLHHQRVSEMDSRHKLMSLIGAPCV